MDAVAQTLLDLTTRYELDAAIARDLAAYVAAVAGWRDANVTGLTDPVDIVGTLVGDALALLDLDEVAIAGAFPTGPWLDLGSGSGVPGVPLAVALPAVRMVLLESIGKKCTFLRHAVAAAGLEGRADVVCSRSEHYAAGPPGRAAHQLVLARAVGPLPTVVELAAPLLAPDGLLVVCTTGGRAGDEATGAARTAQACGVTPGRVVPLAASPLEDSVAALFARTGSLPDRLPRREGLARRKPLS